MGGPLFALGGYGLPFYVFSGFTFLCIPACIFLLETLADEEEKNQYPPLEKQITTIGGHDHHQTCSPLPEQKLPPVTYFQLLAIPKVHFLCILVLLTSTCQNFIFPTLEMHLKSLGESEVVSSLEFFLYSFFYMSSTPLVGKLSDRFVAGHFGILFFGYICEAIGFLLIGPASFATFLHSSVLITSIGLAVMGFFLGFCLVPTFDAILHCSREKGIPNDLHTYGKVSGLWNCMFSLGSVL